MAGVLSATPVRHPQRPIVVQSYIDIGGDFNAYEFLPHSAMLLWDMMMNADPPFASAQSMRAVTAACLIYAQKSVDTSVISLTDCADVFQTTRDAIRLAELDVYAQHLRTNIALQPERQMQELLTNMSRQETLPDPVVRNAFKFFNLSLFCALCTRHCHAAPPSPPPPLTRDCVCNRCRQSCRSRPCGDTCEPYVSQAPPRKCGRGGRLVCG